jgi:RHS repeat-associated protein
VYFNAANEWGARDTDDDGTANYTLTCDAVGNLTDDGEAYKFVYDAFGRLRQVKETASPYKLLAEYTYSGLGHRVGWHYDTDGDGDVDGSDDWFYFAYDDRWRIVGMFKNASSTPDEEYVYHNAGASGFGGSSYIDTVILRLRSSGSERRYYCQNWRADVSVILTEAGGQVERIKYSAYGRHFAMPAGDNDSDGDCNGVDAARFPTSTYDVRCDLDLDGDNDNDDYLATLALSGTTLGYAKLSRPDTANRKGYAGYEHDGKHPIYHVRARVLYPLLGRWLTRDPAGYVDGASLCAYVASRVVLGNDPLGLACGGGIGVAPLGCQPGDDSPAPVPEPPEQPGVTPSECTSCALAALQQEPNRTLYQELVARGCPLSINCINCGTPPTTPRGWTDNGVVTLCADRLPDCNYVALIMSHELWHAYDECQGGIPPNPNCCDCMCYEMRAYRWDRGCENGGPRRSIPGPDGRVPRNELDCLWQYVNLSCSGQCGNVPFFMRLGCFALALSDCWPQSLPAPAPLPPIFVF